MLGRGFGSTLELLTCLLSPWAAAPAPPPEPPPAPAAAPAARGCFANATKLWFLCCSATTVPRNAARLALVTEREEPEVAPAANSLPPVATLDDDLSSVMLLLVVVVAVVVWEEAAAVAVAAGGVGVGVTMVVEAMVVVIDQEQGQGELGERKADKAPSASINKQPWGASLAVRPWLLLECVGCHCYRTAKCQGQCN